MISAGDLTELAVQVEELAVKKARAEYIRDYFWYTGSTLTDAQADEELADSYERIHTISQEICKFTDPEPDTFGELCGYLEQAMHVVESKDAAYLDSDVTLKIAEWRGDAKTKFDQNYITPWPNFRDLHSALLESLRSSAEGHKLLYERMREQAAKIGEAAKTALDGIDENFPVFLTEKEIGDFTLKVAATAIAIATTELTGPLSAAAIAVSVVDIGNSGAGVAASIEGQYVQDIMSKMSKELGRLEDDTAGFEETMSSGLSDNIRMIDDYPDDIVPPQPELGQVDPEDPGGDLKPPAE